MTRPADSQIRLAVLRERMEIEDTRPSRLTATLGAIPCSVCAMPGRWVRVNTNSPYSRAIVICGTCTQEIARFYDSNRTRN